MKLSPAFTLIEILVVVSLIGLLSLGGVTAFITAKNNQDLSQSTDHIVDTIRRAHIFSRDGREEKEWGVRFQAKEYDLIKRFNDSEPAQVDTAYTLPSSVELTGPFPEIWFGKGTGEIDMMTLVHIQNSNNQQTRIRVEKTGVVSYEAL